MNNLVTKNERKENVVKSEFANGDVSDGGESSEKIDRR